MFRRLELAQVALGVSLIALTFSLYNASAVGIPLGVLSAICGIAAYRNRTARNNKEK